MRVCDICKNEIPLGAPVFRVHGYQFYGAEICDSCKRSLEEDRQIDSFRHYVEEIIVPGRDL